MILLLAGCLGTTPQPIEISTKPVDKPNLTLPPVDELRFRNVEWIVLNNENVEEKLKELEAKGIPVGLYALTGEGYENLSLNFSDIRALVQQQQAIIVAYENYYKEASQALDNAVTVE